jgi:hypothetical protein
MRIIVSVESDRADENAVLLRKRTHQQLSPQPKVRAFTSKALRVVWCNCLLWYSMLSSAMLAVDHNFWFKLRH